MAMVISTRDLSGLGDVRVLRRLMQSLAMLDAILSPLWEYRYFSFNSRWAPHKQMGSMRNGQGDHYFALFKDAGCWLKGFDHEAPLSPFTSVPPRIAPGMFEGMPAEFSDCLEEPAFVIEETTFCIWRGMDDIAWRRGPVALPGVEDLDGSAGLLRCLDGDAKTYRQWAEEYYEREVPLPAVESIYAQEPLTRMVVAALNDEVDLLLLEGDIGEIGFPRRS